MDFSNEKEEEPLYHKIREHENKIISENIEGKAPYHEFYYLQGNFNE